MTIKEYLENHDEIFIEDFLHDPDTDGLPRKIRVYTKEQIYAYYDYMLNKEIILGEPQTTYYIF